MAATATADFLAVHWSGEDVPVVVQEDKDNSEEEPRGRGGRKRHDSDADAGDDDDVCHYTVCVYGKTLDGRRRSVCLRVPFSPFFFVEVGLNATQDSLKTLVTTVRRGLGRALEKEYDGCAIRKGRSFRGYAAPNSSGFARLSFKSQRAARRASSWLSRTRPDLRQYETQVDPVIRLLHARGLNPCAVVRIGPGNHRRLDTSQWGRRWSTCDVELELESASALSSPPSTIAIAQPSPSDPSSSSSPSSVGVDPHVIVIASFDIECFSATGDFPDASFRENPVITICTTFSRSGDSSPYYRRIAITTAAEEMQCGRSGAEDGANDVQLIAADSEADMFRRWSEEIAREKTDVLAGYNIWGFDVRYIHRRCLLLGGVLNPSLTEFATNLSRVRGASLQLQSLSVKCSGARYQDAEMFGFGGILQLDAYFYLRRVHGDLESYKLGEVCRRFLGEGADKTGLSIPAMNAAWAGGTPREKWDVARYCVQDATLVARLIHKLGAVCTVFEMANACRVPAASVLLRGEQVKVMSLIVGRTAEAGMLCPAPAPTNTPTTTTTTTSSTSLQGATVLEPACGAYWSAVACLDFQSLYPSIMMAHNLCHSTVLSDGRFVCPVTHRGILPSLLEDLQTKRKEAKAAMVDAMTAGDTHAQTVYNARQLAYKVCMNSVYGFCGANGNAGMLPCMEVAAEVTAIGRSMLLTAKGHVETAFPGAHIVYGDTDSLMIDFGACDYVRSTSIDGSTGGASEIRLHEALAKRAADEVSSLFRRPIKLCFEKCYRPYLLFSKKRYAGLAHVGTDKEAKIDCKGVQFVRRDACVFVKRLCNDVMQCLLRRMDVEGAIEVVRNRVRHLLEDRVPMDELVLSTTIKGTATALLNDRRGTCVACGHVVTTVKTVDDADHRQGGKRGDNVLLRCNSCGAERLRVYSETTSSPAIHVACAKEAAKPGHGPRSGDSVRYVYVRHRPYPSSSSSSILTVAVGREGDAKRRKVTPACERAVDPDVAQKEGLVPDGKYYYDHQVKNVLVEIFGLVFRSEEREPVAVPPSAVERRLLGDILIEHNCRGTGQRLLTTYFGVTTKTECDS